VHSAAGAGVRSASFAVQVTAASFPRRQQLAQRTQLVIAVRNAGAATIPNVAVTITDPPYGTSAQAFGGDLEMRGVASHSRPVWIVDQAPGPCDYSCQAGGPGGAATAYSNTWALGPLRPRATATFAWALTAVKTGTYAVHYEIAAALQGNTRAVLAGGSPPAGTFTVTIDHAPQRTYVNANGQVITTG
jgi:hypothetical protein